MAGYDQVQLSGQLTLGGDLSVVEVNGFSLAVGQTFAILDDKGTTLTSGMFGNATLLGTMYTDAAGDLHTAMNDRRRGFSLW
jgi:hypothetical protein